MIALQKHLVKAVLACLIMVVLMPNVQAQRIDKVGYVERGVASYYPDNREGYVTSTDERYDMHALVCGSINIAFNSYVRVTNLDNNKSIIVRVNDRTYTKGRIIMVTRAVADTLDMIGVVNTDVKVEILHYDKDQRLGGEDIDDEEELAYLLQELKNEEKAMQEMIAEREAEKARKAREAAMLKKAKEDEAKRLEALQNDPIALKKAFMINGIYTTKAVPKSIEGLYGVQTGVYSKIDIALEEARELEEELQLSHVYIKSIWVKNKRLYRVIVGEFESSIKAEKYRLFLEKNDYEGIVKQY